MQILFFLVCVFVGIFTAAIGVCAFLKGLKVGLELKNGAIPQGLFEKEKPDEKDGTPPISKQISEMFRTQAR